MLARPETLKCIECGLPSSAPEFTFHGGRQDHGPAYWCDRGVLCSVKCSLRHTLKREREGTLPQHPAPDIYTR